MGLNILIVSDHYPPFIGGAHRQTQLLSRKLRQRGHQVTVATVHQSGLPAVQDDSGVTVHRLRQLRTLVPGANSGPKQQHQPPFPDPLTVWELRGLINRLQPDLVHAYGWLSYSASFALLGKDIPLLISVRDYAYSCATRTLVYKGVEICSGPAFTKCLGCAAQLYGAPKGYLAVLGVYSSRDLLVRKVRGIHSISTYVQNITGRDFMDSPDPQVIQAIIPSFREETDAPLNSEDPELAPYLTALPTEPFILFVGALRRVKGIAQLFAAYSQLSSPPPLVLIGTREQDTPREIPPGVVILQNLPHIAVMAAWQRAIFGVIPSLWPEPLGSVVYEGMSQGKAVIGTTPGGHTDMIIDHATGLLVPQGDVPALTAAMRELLENPALRVQLGDAARERAHLFTAEIAVPRFEQLYQQLVSLSGGPSNDVHHAARTTENPQYTLSGSK